MEWLLIITFWVNSGYAGGLSSEVISVGSLESCQTLGEQIKKSAPHEKCEWRGNCSDGLADKINYICVKK